VQDPAVGAHAWSSIFWLGLPVGGVVGLALWLLAPLASSFFHDDRVTPILRALGWLALLGALGVTQRAWFAKHLRFRVIAQIEWCGVLIGGVAGLALAASGYGVWSLVWASLLARAATAALFYACCPWRPTRYLRASEVRGALRFGVGLQGFAIVNYFNRHLDDALIGRYLGPLALGYYDRAYTLMLYPVQNVAGVVSSVMFPALCETVAFPTMLGLLVTAPEAIDVIYGHQWAPLVSILQVLCLVGVLQSVGATTGNIFMARARTGLMFTWGAAAAAVLYPSFFIGVHWGVMGVAVAYAVANIILIGPLLVISFRLIELSMSDLVRTLRGVLLGSMLMAAFVAMLRHALLAANFEPHVVLALSVATGVLTYSAWLWATDAEAMREVRSLVWQPGAGGR
jgi:O-antigen/teichoic acid export membrane protein